MRQTLFTICSNEILLQQRLKREHELYSEYQYPVQMKFYYNKDWNSMSAITNFSVIGSNEILLQQRLKPNRESIGSAVSRFKWNSITTKIETSALKENSNHFEVQMKFYYNKDWNYLLHLRSVSMLRSNEILLQQRLKLEVANPSLQ